MSWLTFSGKNYEYFFNNFNGGCQAYFVSPTNYIYLSVTMTALFLSTAAIAGAMTHHWKNSGYSWSNAFTTKVMTSTALVVALWFSISFSVIARMVWVILHITKTDVPHQLEVVLLILSLSSSAINPYVQITLRENLRMSIKNLFRCCCSKGHTNEQEENPGIEDQGNGMQQRSM